MQALYKTYIWLYLNAINDEKSSFKYFFPFH